MPNSSLVKPSSFVALLLGGGILLAFLGFFGVSADNTQYLLGAYERSRPHYLPADWFVQSTHSFHQLFERFIAWWLSRDALMTGLLAWYLTNILWLTAAILMFLGYLGQRDRLPLAIILACGMLVLGVRQGWGHYEILTGQALPAYLAYPPGIMTLLLLFQRRYLLAACALVLTFAIHHGLGALLLLCVAGPFLVTLPRGRDEILHTLAGAALVAVCFAGVVLGTLDRDAGQASDMTILFYGRAPQHYAFQFFQRTTHLATAHIFGAAIVLALCLRDIPMRIKLLSLVVTVAIACMLGYVLLEFWYVPGYVRLFPYRALPLLVVANACMIAFLALDDASSRRTLGVVLLVAASSIVFQYSNTASLTLLLLSAVLRGLPIARHAGAARTTRALVSALTVCPLLALQAYTRPPVFLPPYPTPALRTLTSALHQHTSADDVILVPPELMGLRLAAERAIVVNLKNFPVYGPEMVAWAERMTAISGFDPRMAKEYLRQGANVFSLYSEGYRARSLTDLLTAARHYGARFVLVSPGSRFHLEASASGMQPVWRSRGIGLYPVGTGDAPEPRAMENADERTGPTAPDSSRAAGATPASELRRSPGGYMQLFVEHLEAGRIERAVDAAWGAVALASRNPAAFSNLCAAYTRLAQIDYAITACEWALSLAPGLDAAKANLARARAARIAQPADKQ